MDKKIVRVIDVNFNRAKEGLRVCEDVCRFCYDQTEATTKYKQIRHDLTSCIISLNIDLLSSRDILSDVGVGSVAEEFSRKDVVDIFYANSQRVKESIRVLEEFVKLINVDVASKFKILRYQVYDLEKAWTPNSKRI